MVTDYSLVVLVLGVPLLLYLAKSRWPGWIGLPFCIVVGGLVLEVGITPFAMRVFGYRNPTIAGIAQPDEAPGAIALLLLHTIMLLSGMIAAWYLWDRGHPIEKPRYISVYSTYTFSKAWNASVAMFMLGALFNVVVLGFLLRHISFSSLALERGILTVEEVVWDRTYNYARLLSQIMPIGAWGMLLFAGRSRTRMFLAITANFAELLLQILFGGRARVIITLLSIGMIYHYGIKRLKLRHLVMMVGLGFISLLIIQFTRLGVTNLSESVIGNLGDTLVTGGINETAFALGMFPEQIPFIGFWAVIGPLTHLFPTLGDHIPGTNLWMRLVEYLFGGHNPTRGIGGEHYVPAAEHYMLLGLGGVIFLAFAYGLSYGCIFTSQRRHKQNLFLLMFATYAFKAFFISVIDGKMTAWIGGMGFGALLPIGILTAISYRRSGSGVVLLGALYISALSFFLKRWTNLDIFDYTFAIVLIPAYIACINVIGKADPLNDRMWRVATRSVTSNRTFSVIPRAFHKHQGSYQSDD